MIITAAWPECSQFYHPHVVQHKAVTKKENTDLGSTYRHSTNLQIQASFLDCMTFIFKDLQNSETKLPADYQKKGKKSSKNIEFPVTL